MFRVALAIALTVALATSGVSASYISNRFLGSCLTDAWVQSMETTNKVNASERDAQGRLVNPFLHAAKRHPAFRVDDPRTASSGAYDPNCIPKGGVVYGAGVTVDKDDKVVDNGVVNGAFVVELSGWTTHSLTSLVFSIIAAEVLGFPVAHYQATNTAYSAQRMSSAPNGLCTPIHVNLEVWTVGKEVQLRMYNNESFLAGPVGYVGSSGLYTTSKFVQEFANTTLHPQPQFPQYWMSYKLSDDVINAVPLTSLTGNNKFFPPTDGVCTDGVMGCQNYCSRTATCTAREAQGKKCLLVVLMYPYYEPGYFQSVLANLGIPAYFCSIGFDGVEAFAKASEAADQPVIFYHFEPNLFHSENAGKYERIFLPRSLPERAVLATGIFGENGYGLPSSNPVDVDFPVSRLAKYAATLLQKNKPASQLVSRFALEELDMNQLLRLYTSAAADPAEKDPTFRAACNWVKSSFNTWSMWMDRLPLCTFEAHIKYEVTGCNDTGGRAITFAWNVPNPDDLTLPYECDGGLARVPAPIRTSRSCEWIEANTDRWRGWITAKPECDASFYKYNVTDCDASAKRTIQYWWLLPSATDATKSQECVGGVSLPASVRIDCDYMPTSSSTFAGLAVIAGIMIGVQALAMGFVFVFRNKPIIKRSQYEFLLLMLFGGILVCVAAILYAGRPSKGLCAGRPLVISLGFTTVFGSLFVKSLRVYRVFMKTALKRVTVTVWMMFKVFGLFFFVDVLILAVWFIADFPEPTITMKPPQGFQGDVDRIQCRSSSFVFTAILIFWKAMLLFLGLYISFLVRNVSADFQESIWIFASSVIVLVSCLFILPLAYMIEMAAAAFYVFLACALIVSTAVVMSMMLVPKLHRLNEEAKSSKYSTNASSRPSTRPDDTTTNNTRANQDSTSVGTAAGTSKVQPLAK